MAMLEGFFGRVSPFKAGKCKTLLKLTIPRIKLLRNHRENQLKQMRRDIAKLLQNGQESTARIRVEHIIREENMMAAHEILELFCELITVRLPIIETQKECPLDLKEAISSICFAAPRCADLPELMQVQALFAAKYGKEFVSAATELMPDSGVNRQIIELLSVRAPSTETKLKLLTEIAEEHELDWDPSATITEFSKSHEDLLNGPTYLGNGPRFPVHKKHEESSPASNVVKSHEVTESDSEFLDLPEVPKSSLKQIPDISSTNPTSDIPSAHDHIIHQPDNMPPPAVGLDDDSSKPISMAPEPLVSPPYNQNVPVVPDGNKQFLPSVSPSSSFQQGNPVPFPSASVDPTGPDLFKDHPETKSSSTSHSSVAVPIIKNGEASQMEPEIDLQDVLTAAQSAFETAERAASAARNAATLAKARISKLQAKETTNTSDSTLVVEKMEIEKPIFDRQDSSLSEPPMEESPSPYHQPFHVPERLPSMEDDPYYAYPSLFSSTASTNNNT